MDVAVETGSQIEEILATVDSENPFDHAYEDILPKQIRAANDRFQDRVNKIKLLKNRADTGGVTEVKTLADLVPLLFAHTAYKSYPENWLFEGKWDRMGKWLDTVSTGTIPPIAGPVEGLDDWLAQLEQHGHYLACSSGTTGKCSMMDATASDLVFAGKCSVATVRCSGVEANQDRLMIGLGQSANTARSRETGRPMMQAFMKPGSSPCMPNVPPITMGKITGMVILRKKIADGTAKPSEVARFESEGAQRQKDADSAAQQVADALIERRHEKLHIGGMYPSLFNIAKLVCERGYSSKDFQENTAYIAGGLKRAHLPPDYQQFIFDTLNMSADRVCLAYGMQELNTSVPRCSAGRYHMPPWLMLLLLDEPGEKLLEPTEGEIEGRAAFFDISLEGRWGGVISGDKVRAAWGACKCGNRSPSIDQDIQRYADTASGDKIACSGTIDAYVRGVA